MPDDGVANADAAAGLIDRPAGEARTRTSARVFPCGPVSIVLLSTERGGEVGGFSTSHLAVVELRVATENDLLRAFGRCTARVGDGRGRTTLSWACIETGGLKLLAVGPSSGGRPNVLRVAFGPDGRVDHCTTTGTTGERRGPYHRRNGRGAGRPRGCELAESVLR